MRIPVFCACCIVSSIAHATVPDPFVQTEALTIPSNPQVTSFAWAPDASNRLFVTGKGGAIWIVKDGALLPTPAYKFVNLDEDDNGELVVKSECGLLGIAFDPAFVDNGHIYVFATLYVPTPTGKVIEQQILRVTMQGDVATDRTTLIAGLPSRGENHDGGALAFGPDGLLYWAVGNNGSGEGQGQDLASAGSKLSRASTIPGAPAPPGPYNDGSGPNYDYTFARGLRNPYTMAFHPVTGVPWVNVVGDSWEQIFALSLADHVGYPMENVDPGTGDATTSPIVVYRTGTPPDLTIVANAAVRASNVVTITTSTAHNLRKGGTVSITGIDDASFDSLPGAFDSGFFPITSVPTPTTFTYEQTGPDATSGNGAARGADYGSVVLGGAFYDATLFPPAYRQNFFFGDFSSGQIVRVETASDASIARVRTFGTNTGRHIDAATGPDGSLWIVNHDGNIRRIGYTATTPGIVVSPQNLRLSETARGFVGVRLALAPTTDVTVTLARVSGSTFVSVPAGAITFTPANWDRPQYVEVTSAIDADLVEDVAMLDATATGYPGETVTVRVTDTREPLPLTPDDLPATDGTPPPSGGCCHVGESSDGLVALGLGLVVTGALRRRRRRTHQAW